MEYRFKCKKCNEEIVTKHLEFGEPAKCKKCGEFTKVYGEGIEINKQDQTEIDINDSVNIKETEQEKKYLFLFLANIFSVLNWFIIAEALHLTGPGSISAMGLYITVPVSYIIIIAFVIISIVRKEKPVWAYFTLLLPIVTAPESYISLYLSIAGLASLFAYMMLSVKRNMVRSSRKTA